MTKREKADYMCPNCGDKVMKARWDAGYEYCKKSTCFDAVGRTARKTKDITIDSYDPDELRRAW